MLCFICIKGILKINMKIVFYLSVEADIKWPQIKMQIISRYVETKENVED